jgi:hypothetical protein
VRDNWSMFFSSTLVAGSCSLLGLYIYIYIYLYIWGGLCYLLLSSDLVGS